MCKGEYGIMISVLDYEIFKFKDNSYTKFINNGREYWLNQHPYLDIVLTDRCNQKCKFCIADLIHNKLDCDLSVFKRKIEYAIKHLNVDEVLLLGGEPTISKNLIPMIKWLNSLGLNKIIMTTNGLKLAAKESFAEEILSSGLTHLNVSMMSINENEQKKITGNNLSLENIDDLYFITNRNNVKLRINTNIFNGNNDTIEGMIDFYDNIKFYTDSVKFSPLFPVDNFSVINKVSKWVNKNSLSNEYLEKLFYEFEEHFIANNSVGIITNENQFGFVKNTIIPLHKPIIMNWNFGKYTNMMNRVTERKEINNIKLLPNGELSLSWNRELDEYFITEEL